MKFYTIKRSDVGKRSIRAFGRSWPVEDWIGSILVRDVGKRVYRRGDILQVENDQQLAARSNPPAGWIPVKAVKITRKKGYVEVRIRKTGRKGQSLIPDYQGSHASRPLGKDAWRR